MALSKENFVNKAKKKNVAKMGAEKVKRLNS
jgi:hypothetical protein